MPRTVAIHQPECFPWLGFLDKAAQADVFILLDDVQFEKNYYQNRNKLRTADGWSWLTIPVLTTGRSKQTIAEVEIEPDPHWRRKHLASWTQNYRPARFGARYLPFLEKLYAGSQRLLAEFNREVILWLFEQFQIKAEVRFSAPMATSGASTERLVNLCRGAGADVYLSGISGKEYIDEALFRDAGIALRYQEFYHPIYAQRFEPFIPSLTSLDLLFNHGPDSAKILRDAATPRMKTLFT